MRKGRVEYLRRKRDRGWLEWGREYMGEKHEAGQTTGEEGKDREEGGGRTRARVEF